jgi:hypothetical protein
MSGDHINASVGGDVHGQMATGKDIRQKQVTGAPLTQEERAELAGEFEALRRQVAAEAPAELQAGATERVTELEEALTAEKPDLTTVQYVKRWFARNLPALAGSLTSLLVHPLVGRLVQAGGDALVAEFADVTRD